MFTQIMFTVKALIRKETIRKDGTAPVYIRLVKDRKVSYYKLGFLINVKEWSEKNESVKSFIGNDYNYKIESVKNKIKSFALAHPNKTAKEIINEFELNNTDSVYEFFEEYLCENKERLSYQFHKHMTSVLNKLKEFESELTFDKLDVSYLDQYINYCLSIGNSKNTAYGNLKKLRIVINEAVKRGRIRYENNPFLNYKMKSFQVKEKYLTIEEINSIENYNCSGVRKLAKDTYLFSFYCAGIRFSDVALMKKSNIENGRLRYKMNKSQKYKDIKLPQKTIEILSRYKTTNYLFPIIRTNSETKEDIGKEITNRNALINKELKIIQKDLGIKTNLSFHTARHSFANFAVKKKIHVKTIQELLGHSSLTTTQEYLRRFDNEDSDKAMDDLFG